MAQYYSEVDYCAEEMNRPHGHGGGGEHYAVRKETYEEVDGMARANHHHGGSGGLLGGSHSGHLGYSGSRHGGGHMGGHEGGYRREEHIVHGPRLAGVERAMPQWYERAVGQYHR
uniref:Uncharacterized protein n=1 Tax=Leersia perrieri TaxID=77586 RepID=A0A0D9V9B7_9ORYZ